MKEGSNGNDLSPPVCILMSQQIIPTTVKKCLNPISLIILRDVQQIFSKINQHMLESGINTDTTGRIPKLIILVST